MIHRSYWLETAPEGEDYTRAPVPPRVDVAIVGGGITGLSAAIHLRRKGASVALFEAERMGWGASGRNGGMCTTGLSIKLAKSLKRFGVEGTAKLYKAYDDAIDTVEGLVRDEQIACDFVRAGKLALASKASHYEGMAKSHDIMNQQLGRNTVLIPKDRLRDEIGSDAYFGAWVDPPAAGLHVAKYVRGLAASAARAGAALLEAARVDSIKQDQGGRYRVSAARGSTSAKQVLVATDGYTGGVIGHFARRIVPVGSFIVTTERLEPSLVAELMPTRRVAVTSKNLIHYFRITPDDRMLFGGRAQWTTSNDDSDARSAEILTRDLARVFPVLSDRRIDYAWGGQVGMTLDRLPHAGQHRGIFYSLGYNGHGVHMATYMGRQMVEVMDGRPDANPWNGVPFRAVPFHVGPPWFLPFADTYFRFRDAIS